MQSSSRRTITPITTPLPITLRHPLQLVLLLNSIAVTAALRRIDQLLCQALRHALHIPEGRLPGSDRKKGDGLVDTAERGDIDGLTTDGTGGTNTCAVFAGSAVDDGIDRDLDGVLVGHDVDLIGRAKLADCLFEGFVV